MNDLIKALLIFYKYMPNTKYPTHCEHDVLLVLAPQEISEEDTKELNGLSFHWDNEREGWRSYRFGRA